MMQIAVQRVAARPVVARSAAVDGICRAGKASVSVISGSVAKTVRRLAWLRLAGGAAKGVFSAFFSFWNIPVLGAEETQESRYLRTGRFN
jgi:hypothetical protein